MWLTVGSGCRSIAVRTSHVFSVDRPITGLECLAVRVMNSGRTSVTIRALDIRLGGLAGGVVMPREWGDCELPVHLEAGTCWSAPLVPVREILGELNDRFQPRFWPRNRWKLYARVETEAHGGCRSTFFLSNRVASRPPMCPENWEPPLIS